MKASFMYLAAGAMLLTACSQTDMITEVDINGIPEEITFATFADKATKAAEVGLEDHHTTFTVWGSKKAGDTYTKVYDGMTITHEASGDVWKPAEKRYWDKAAKNYYFFAAAPSTLSWALTYKDETVASADYSDATVKLSNYLLKGDNVAAASSDAAKSWINAANDKDLMLADAKSQTSGTVNLSFKHILSRLNIKVLKGIDETVKLEKLEIYKVKNLGSFDESLNNYTAGTTLRWGTASASGDYVPKYTNASGLSLDKTGLYVLETLIIPQNMKQEDGMKIDGSGSKEQAYLYLEYKIGSEPYFGYYNLAKTFVASGDAAFNEGQQNTLTITIGNDDDLIKFDAITSDWSTGKTGSLDL